MSFYRMIEAFEQLTNETTRLCKLIKSLETKQSLQELKESIMSQITDFATSEQNTLTEIQTSLNTLATGIANLDSIINAFQNSPGTLSVEDQAALTTVQSVSNALAKQAQGIVVTPPVGPSVVTPAITPVGGEATPFTPTPTTQLTPPAN